MNKLIIGIISVVVVAGVGFFLVKIIMEEQRPKIRPNSDTSSQGSDVPIRDRVNTESTTSGSATQSSGSTTIKPSQATIQDVAVKVKALDSTSSDFSSSNASMSQVDDTTQL